MFHFIFLHIYEVYSKGIARKLVSRKVEGTTDISISQVDFSSDGSSRTRRVITTRQHFQAASPPPLSSHMHDFFKVSHQLTFPTVGSTFQVTARHELDGSSRLVNIFRCLHCLHCFRKQFPVTLLSKTSRPDFRLTGRFNQKVDPTPFVCIGQRS